MSEKWDKRFYETAQLIASWSKDRSTQVGAVIVGPNREIRSTGYNGLPRRVRDNVDRRMDERPYKYLWAEHAERNAIYDAARRGASVEGCAIYVSALLPCADCARAIIQAGLIEVVSPTDLTEAELERWGESTAVGLQMFREAGVLLRSPMGGPPPYMQTGHEPSDHDLGYPPVD